MDNRPLLKLGSVDANVWPATLAEQIKFKTAFLAKYHAAMNVADQKKLKFRDEKDSDAHDSGWSDFRPVPGAFVRELQDFLIGAGFLPETETHGVFSYRTQAAARLFQEYVRSMEGHAELAPPDGIVGPKTWAHVDRWKQQGFKTEWAGFSAQHPSPEYTLWLNLLATAKTHYTANPGPVLEHIEAFQSRPGAPQTATLKIADWKTGADTIHFIGIRRKQDEKMSLRRNDDLFVLLIRGLVFKFLGSADPQVDESGGKGRPFLTEGQHNYHFGWHKINTKPGQPERVYRALKPSGGVLVFRDKDLNGALSAEEIAKFLDPNPNTTINIHWAGKDGSNFSAGCQVIAGMSYFNHANQLQDCSGFAAGGYQELALGKTRGAYNVFTDLLLCYAPPGVQDIAYTLGRDETLSLSDQMGEQFAAARVSELRKEV